MWQKWARDLSVELHWLKREMIYRWKLDTPAGIMGILIVISGLSLFMVIVNAVAQIFRSFVPWVSGSRVGEVYWQSVGFGIKASLIFLVFTVSIIMFFLLKLSKRG